ncbi:MAG TPA: hypothetical protein VGO67_04205 [Verrucomicrobiae bacterium]
MTATFRGLFCLAISLISFNSAFAQHIILEGNSLSNRFFNTDEAQGDTIFATDFTVTNAGTLQDIVTWGQNSGNAGPVAGATFNAYVLRPVGSNFQVMADSGTLTVADVGTNFFAVPPFNLEVGDVIAHYGRGIPLTTDTGGPSTAYYSGGVLAMPIVGDVLQLPSSSYPLYNDGGRNYAIAVNIGDRVIGENSGGLQALNIALTNGSVVVSWHPTSTNALLQTTDLATGVWTPNNNFIYSNGTSVLTIPSPVGNIFFRLQSN